LLAQSSKCLGLKSFGEQLNSLFGVLLSNQSKLISALDVLVGAITPQLLEE